MIRPAVKRDETSVRTCAENAYARYVAAIGRKPAPMVADFAAQIAAGAVHVAVDARGVPQGFVVFFTREGQRILENVAVQPAAAGRGIATSLIRFCEDNARRLGLGAVHLYTNEKMTDNLSFYARLGYVEVDRRTEDGFNGGPRGPRQAPRCGQARSPAVLAKVNKK